jgi:hypothetical protein
MKNLFILFIVLFSIDVNAQSKTIVPSIIYDSVTNRPDNSGTQHDSAVLTRIRILGGETTSVRADDDYFIEKKRINSEIKKLQSEIEALKKVINILINK